MVGWGIALIVLGTLLVLLLLRNAIKRYGFKFVYLLYKTRLGLIKHKRDLAKRANNIALQHSKRTKFRTKDVEV